MSELSRTLSYDIAILTLMCSLVVSILVTGGLMPDEMASSFPKIGVNTGDAEKFVGTDGASSNTADASLWAIGLMAIGFVINFLYAMIAGIIAVMGWFSAPLWISVPVQLAVLANFCINVFEFWRSQ